METAIGILVGLCLLLTLVAMRLRGAVDRLRDELEEERSARQSLSTTYGQISEQWFPLMEGYPYDSRRFRFLGSPVDGIQFEDDRIVFCEFKTNRSDLSPVQRQIRRLVQEKRVFWEEFHIRADG